jgi:integrase
MSQDLHRFASYAARAGHLGTRLPRRGQAASGAAREVPTAGLRQGELVALRWRDVDFAGSYIRVTASHTNGETSTPKSGEVRAVPMAPEVGAALAQPARRDEHTNGDDLVFVGVAGGHLDASALLRSYRTALRAGGLRPLRFHDLRHTCGTRVIVEADIRREQEWMCHADVQTTMRYLHYSPRHGDAALVARAFA